MILTGRHVELIPFVGWDDWEYAFKLAGKHDKRLTPAMMLKEGMENGFQFYVGYVHGIRSGVVFAKHYLGGLSLDAYSEMKGGALFSLEAAHLMFEHLFKFTTVVYVRFDKGDIKLHRFCKMLNLVHDHEENGRVVYSKTREDYKSFTWDDWDNSEQFTHAENTIRSRSSY